MSRPVPRRRVRLLSTLLLSLLVGLTGVTGVALAPSASAAPKGKIQGVVTDAEGMPLADIVAQALRLDEVDGGTFGEGTTATKNDGSYAFNNLPPGRYTVRFFDVTDTYATEYYDGAFLDIDATFFEVAAGDTVTGIDAHMELAGELGGVVTDGQGQPLADIDVTMRLFVDGDPNHFGGTFTGPDGRWRMTGLEPGAEYLVEFSDGTGDHVTEFWDDQPVVWEADPLVLEPGEVRDDVDAELADGGHITGTVTEADGTTPIPGITVDVSRLVDGEWTFVDEDAFYSTDELGFYDIGGLPAGTYRLQFLDEFDGTYLDEWFDDATEEDPTLIVVGAGETVSGKDASLDRAARVSGTVTGPGGVPLEGIQVTVRDEVKDAAQFVETDADGNYEARHLPPGSYWVQFEDFEGDHAREFWEDAVAPDDATLLDIGLGDQVTGIDAELAEAAHIEGDVTAAPGQGELFFFGVDAIRLGSSGTNGLEHDSVEIAFPETEGGSHYELGGLPPGTYRLEFQGSFIEGGVDAREFYDDQPSFELAQDIEITEAGQVLTGYDAELEAGSWFEEVTNQTPPTISGSPVVGQTLTASPGTWAPDGAAFEYQWLAGGLPVGTGATTYVPTAADLGKTITVVVTASILGLGDGVESSDPTAAVTATGVVPPGPPGTPGTPGTPGPASIDNTRLPRIKGDLEVGEKVRVTAGGWTPAGVTLSYRWYAGGDPVRGARERTLVIKPALKGERLRVKVTATASGYAAEVVRTSRSGRVGS